MTERLRPVPESYAPEYPEQLTQREVDELLEPGLAQRFSSKVLKLGAALGGASAMALAGYGVASGEQISGQAPPLTVPSKATIDRDVEQLIVKLRGPDNSGHHPRARPNLQRELPSNIEVKYPVIEVHYGNSYMGVIDSARAKAAAKQLFALYGIHLQDDVPIKGSGYEFTADGYDPATKVGFELIESRYTSKSVAPRELLEPTEINALDADVRTGKARFFVARADRFPVVDLDRHASWSYYLESVAEYLRWIHRP